MTFRDPDAERMRLWSHDRFTFPLPAGHRFPLSKYRLLRERVEAVASTRSPRRAEG